jgi:hypothetical protein
LISTLCAPFGNGVVDEPSDALKRRSLTIEV